jgi:hypothetical protein
MRRCRVSAKEAAMHVSYFVAAAMILCAPVAAEAGSPSDIVRIFGRDPGAGQAHSCFRRQYTNAHLAAHPDQNVTDMLLLVDKQEGTDPYYGLTMQVNFRQLAKPFQVAGSCGVGTEGTEALGCGIDCDGGTLSVRVKNDMSLLVAIPASVRLYDPADIEGSAEGELPDRARFGADDKLFRLDRTALEDCVPVINDTAVKAGVLKGEITQ